MKYRVFIDGVSREQWERNAQLFADYSIYQTWPYQQVRGEMDGQDISCAIVIDEADNPVTMCQVRIKKVKGLRLRIGYVQSGPLLRRKKGEPSCPVEAFRELRNAYVGPYVDVLRVVPNIIDDEAGKLISCSLEQGGFERVGNFTPYRTFIVQTDDSHEGIRSRLRKSFRRDLKKAEKLGMQLSRGTGNEFCKLLEDLYIESIRRKGFKGLNPEEFTRTQGLLLPSEKMDFFAVSQDGEPIAVLLSSSLGDTSLVLLAAANEKGLECGASYIVWYQGALAAKDAGMKAYDLGGIDKKHNPNVYQFKSRIGGEETCHIGAFEANINWIVKSIWRVAERIYRRIKR